MRPLLHEPRQTINLHDNAQLIMSHSLQKIELNFSAIIFDMDGLVLDTESTYFTAWQKASAEMGYDLSQDFCLSLSGMHYQTIEQQLLDFFGINFDLKQFSLLSEKHWYELINNQGIPVKKGFLNLLAVLITNNIPFCLATNSSKSNALVCLKLSNLNEVFSMMVTSDDVKEGKPAPEIFFAAAKLLSIPVSKCLVLEDSMTGIKAAADSGASSVLIPSIIPVKRALVELADYCFNDLDELAQIINQKYSHPV